MIVNYASSADEAETTARLVREAGAEAVLVQGDVEHIFVERVDSVSEADLDAFRQQIVLAEEIFLLRTRTKFGIVSLPKRQKKWPAFAGRPSAG